MDTTVLQPGAGQTVVATNDHHNQHRNHDHHDHCRHDSIEARADFRALTNEIERFGTVNGDRIRDTAAAGALAAARTDSLVQTGFGDTSDRICAGVKDLTGAVGSGFTAAALAACKTQDEVSAVYVALQKQLSDTATATVVGFKDAQAISYQIEGRSSLDAAKNAAAIGLQATTNANALSVEATKNAYQAALDAQRYASAAQLEAEKNAAAVALKFCECCNEIQSQADRNLAAITATVVAGNQSILGKMDQTTIDNLRAQLVATQRLIPVTVPVGAG